MPPKPGCKQVTVTKIKNLTNDLVKAAKIDQIPYPQPRNKSLPKSFFLAAFCGARGSGKTALCIRLLKDYEESGIFDERGNRVPQIVILVSPTSESNAAFKQLKHLAPENTYQQYTDKLLLGIIDEIKKDMTLTRKYKQACYLERIFNKHISRGRDPLLAMPRDELQMLSAETNGFRDKPKVPPHPFGCVTHLVLDDCVSSPAFNLNRSNAFSGFTLNARHSWANIYLISQRAKQIPPIIRSNLTLIAIWRASLTLLCDEVWPLLDEILPQEEDFLALFKAATGGNKYDALVIDKQADEGAQIRKNLDQQLRLK